MPDTIQDVVNDVLTELRLASGQDVQVHLQEGIRLDISRLYRTLMKKHVWKDYHFTTAFTTDADGVPTDDFSSVLDRYSNIIAVYLDNATQPVPHKKVLSNPNAISTPTIAPNGTAQVFTIYPTEIRTGTVISKFYSETNLELTDAIPFYRDLLVLGAAFMLANKMGINPQLTASLENQFNNLLSVYTIDEMEDVYTIGDNDGVTPSDWYLSYGS